MTGFVTAECEFSIADVITQELRSLAVAQFTVPGTPVSWERPRRNPKTKSWYTPKKTLDAEENVAAAFLAANPGWTRPIEGASFGLLTLFRLPDGRGRDVDNMVKLVMDGLNRVAWADDRQVAEQVSRVDAYSSFPGTGVVIYRCRARGTKPAKREKCPKG